MRGRDSNNARLDVRTSRITIIYTQLLPFKEEEQFICKVTLNAREAIQLVEYGFTYVKGEYNNGGKIFKKPKWSVDSVKKSWDGNCINIVWRYLPQHPLFFKFTAEKTLRKF
jgi:hypothetical protein